MRIISLFLFLLMILTIILGGLMVVALIAFFVCPQMFETIIESHTIRQMTPKKPVESCQPTAQQPVQPIEEKEIEPIPDDRHCPFQIVRDPEEENIFPNYTKAVATPHRMQKEKSIDTDAEEEEDDEKTEVERRNRLRDEYLEEIEKQKREVEERKEQEELLDDLIMGLYF